MGKINYAWNTIQALHSYHSSKITCPNYPNIADVELTNACNLSCTFCERQLINARGIGFMHQDTFQAIINARNQKMIRNLSLFMHGEPTLHPHLVDFVSIARNYCKNVGFTTNGMLLNKNLGHSLLEAGLTNICFSFEGTSKQAYEMQRHGGKWEVVASNINSFLIARREMEKKCHVSIAIIDSSLTHSGLQNFVEYWRYKGVNQIIILPLHDWGLHGKREHICLWPWWGMAVYWNGDVSPCCLSEQAFKLGNVLRTPVEEIWNSNEYKDFRYNMLNHQTCLTCSLQTFSDSYLRVTKPSFRAFATSVWRLLRSGF